MLLSMQQSCFLLVDVQQKLIPFIHNSEALIKNCHWLMRLSNVLEVPIVVSEQYPQGLGQTVALLKETAQQADALFLEKVAFSCASDEVCLQKIRELNKPHIVIAGIEAHVCVMQTAIQLQQIVDQQVFVVADAISSRDIENVQLARARMRDAGVEIVSREMVLFEWLRQAGTPLFKQVSQDFLRE